MDKTGCAQTVVSAIIPSLNEEKTLGSVVRVLAAHPLIDEVLVVDDGSTDATSEVAEAAGARVLRLARNQGKAEAMAAGMRATDSEIILFLDGDLLGLNREMISKLIVKVQSGEYEMYAGVQDRGWELLNDFADSWSPVLSGFRALRREVWGAVPERHKRHYQIEIAFNYFASRAGFRRGHEIMPGLSQVIKEKKRGLWWGLYQRFFLMRDVAAALLKFYIWEDSKRLIKTLFDYPTVPILPANFNDYGNHNRWGVRQSGGGGSGHQ